MFRTVDPTWRLDWLKREHKLSEHLDGGSRPYGPFHAKGFGFHVRYDAETGAWELLQFIDTSTEDYHRARAKVIRLADEHRDHMGRVELVRFLIQAAIETGITRRSDILDTVELAANLEAVQRSIDTGVDYTSIPTEFDAAFIKAVFDRGRGTQRGRGLWWVDSDKNYHLYWRLGRHSYHSPQRCHICPSV